MSSPTSTATSAAAEAKRAHADAVGVAQRHARRVGDDQRGDAA